MHLPRFYNTKVHFGFTIAGNRSTFRITPKPNSELPDTVIAGTRYQIKTVYPKSSPNFGLGLVVDARLQRYLRLRFTPNITFSDRKIVYNMSTYDLDSSKIYEKTVESVLLLFPLELKIQSKRSGNFSAYVIGGGGYSLDLTARKKAGSAASSGGANQLDDNLKLQRDDFFYSAGYGVDFYLQYFKFGVELKLVVGTKNLLSPTNNVFSNSIEKIRSRMVLLTFTFEG